MLVHGCQDHGNIMNHGDGNRNRSSKLYPYNHDPYYSYDDDASDRTSFDIGCPQGVGTPLLSPFIPTPAIDTASAGSISGNNTNFGVKFKSGEISGNEDLITHASMHTNKNDNSMHAELEVNLPTLEQGYLLLEIRQWNPRHLQIVFQIWIPYNTPSAVYNFWTQCPSLQPEKGEIHA